jgi:hypothetical protein
MLEVFINSARTYVPIGTKLQFILPHVSTSERATLIQTLRVERSFQGKAIWVQLPPDPDAVSQLLLFGKDRVSWSKALRDRK